jgi:hypothetical protein
MPVIQLGDVTHVIQLAIAPVFLLTAVGTLLNVLANRLGRAVDRRSVLNARLAELGGPREPSASAELEILERRFRLIYAAIFQAVLCALLICLLIALAFVDALIAFDLSRVVAVLFVLAMLALIGSLATFLREIYLGVNTVRCPIV